MPARPKRRSSQHRGTHNDLRHSGVLMPGFDSHDGLYNGKETPSPKIAHSLDKSESKRVQSISGQEEGVLYTVTVAVRILFVL